MPTMDDFLDFMGDKLRQEIPSNSPPDLYCCMGLDFESWVLFDKDFVELERGKGGVDGSIEAQKRWAAKLGYGAL